MGMKYCMSYTDLTLYSSRAILTMCSIIYSNLSFMIHAYGSASIHELSVTECAILFDFDNTTRRFL